MASRYERLSPLDASFLYAESRVAHMHVGSLSIFEDPGLTTEEFYRHIERRLDLVPRFRKKLMWVPFDLGRPVWVDDEHFDVRFHVRHTGLARPGGETELKLLMGRLMSIPLDRDRPLWELWLVDLPRKRKALIQKTHHALIDGISGVDLATVLLDVCPETDDPPPVPWKPQPPPTPAELLKETLVEQAIEPREVLRRIRKMLQAPRAVKERVVETAKGMLNLGKASLDVAPKTSLSRQIGPHRRFEIVRTKLSEIKGIKNRAGCKVNDVVLALVAGGLRHLLLTRGDAIDGLEMRVAVPVSVRDPSERMTLGNRVAMMFACLPVGEPDPMRRLTRIQREMADVKESKEAIGADALVKLAGFAPPTILALAARAVAVQWMANLTVTNVPGPQFPLYLRGGRMLEAFPFVPLIGTMSVGVAVLSYDGKLNFGLSGDWDVVPDLGVFAEGIEGALSELKRCCGLSTRARRKGKSSTAAR
ncbi:MAG: wax ester/triacylglycerol synthase family O-acyltransferase [Deltaproteobacteria bacterium]|nr:MAG: wax ester/triacylglycerol synthase family O-acyltransferase [Deltaproteobacteria bacterium]